MRAIKYHGVHNLELAELPVPEPGKGQVLVKILYCGICGTDVHAYNMPGIFDWELVPGHEAVGIVEKVGEGVTCVSAGDRVAVGPPGDCGRCYSCNTGHPNTCAHAFPETLGIGPGTQGAYAEYVLSKHPENELFCIPEGMELEQAVLFDVIGVGFHAVRKSRLAVGDAVVVSGCGSIGLSVIQFAKMAGARTIVALDVLEGKRRTALKAGADYAFEPGSEADMEQIRSILAHQNGAHVCFETAGHPDSVKSCVSCTMANGQIMMVGSDGRPYELVSAALGPMEYDFQFSFTYTKEEIYMLFEMIAAGKLDTGIYSLQKAKMEEAEKKIIQLSRGELDVARVLLMPNGQPD